MLISLLNYIRLNKGKLPTHKYYEQTVKLADEIAVHSSLEGFPHKLFQTKAPNENHQEREYRIKSYQPETRAIWNKAISETNRIFNRQNYSVEFNNEEQEIEGIEETFKNIVLNRKLNDANGLLTIFPNKVKSDTELYNPKIKIFSSFQVLDYNIEGDSLPSLDYDGAEYLDTVGDEFEPNYFLLLSNSKSMVTHGNGQKEEGLILYYMDAYNTYEIRQVGRKTEYNFQIFPLFAQETGHQLGYIPAYFLGGIEVTNEDICYFKSFFQDAVPSLNQALYDSSNLSMIKVAHVFPQRIEYVDVCDEDGCEGGQICSTDVLTNFRSCVTCNTCHGTGYKQKQSPLGVYQMKTPERLQEGDVQIPFPGVAYVAPPSEPLTFLRDEIFRNERKSFDFIGLNVTSTSLTNQGKDTATGVIIDRESLFAFLKGLSSQVFELMEATINSIGRLKFGITWDGVEIKEPSSFEIRTANDLTDEYAVAVEGGLPPSYITMIGTELQRLRFGHDEVSKLKRYALGDLYNKSTMDLATLYGAGLINKERYFLIENFDRLASNIENITELPMADAYKRLLEIVKKELPTPVLTFPDGV